MVWKSSHRAANRTYLGREVGTIGMANTYCVPGSELSISQALSRLILKQVFEVQMRKRSHRAVKVFQDTEVVRSVAG